jgi:hypothetical protein
MPDGPRYEDDFYAWTQHQSEVLRSLRVDDNRFDREHVAEEIEDLGKSERDAARSQIRRILEHLLKLQYSPARDPQFDRMDSILDARATLSDKLSPSLRRDAIAELEKLYADARRRAALGLQKFGETRAAANLPTECPYSFDQVCEPDWYPPPPTRSARRPRRP